MVEAMVASARKTRAGHVEPTVPLLDSTSTWSRRSGIVHTDRVGCRTFGTEDARMLLSMVAHGFPEETPGVLSEA